MGFTVYLVILCESSALINKLAPQCPFGPTDNQPKFGRGKNSPAAYGMMINVRARDLILGHNMAFMWCKLDPANLIQCAQYLATTIGL
jgi:hypothetical protein